MRVPIIISAVMLISCKSGTHSEVVEQQGNGVSTAKDSIEHFDVFYNNFLRDSTFRLQRTLAAAKKGRSDFESTQRTYALIHDLSFGYESVTDTLETALRIDVEPFNVIETVYDKTGTGRSQRHFGLLKNQWFLIKYDSLPWFIRGTKSF